MKLMGRKKTLSLASSVALRVRRAVACESFCAVRLKYCGEGSSASATYLPFCLGHTHGLGQGGLLFQAVADGVEHEHLQAIFKALEAVTSQLGDLDISCKTEGPRMGFGVIRDVARPSDAVDDFLIALEQVLELAQLAPQVVEIGDDVFGLELGSSVLCGGSTQHFSLKIDLAVKDSRRWRELGASKMDG